MARKVPVSTGALPPCELVFGASSWGRMLYFTGPNKSTGSPAGRATNSEPDLPLNPTAAISVIAISAFTQRTRRDAAVAVGELAVPRKS